MLIDEVQKVSALLDVLQVIIDTQPRRFRFLLSGSSARKLKRDQANLLPGRQRLFLFPLPAAVRCDDIPIQLQQFAGGYSPRGLRSHEVGVSEREAGSRPLECLSSELRPAATCQFACP